MFHARGWREAKELATRVYRESERKHLALAAAGVAYYFLMSLVPALALLAAVATYLPLLNDSGELASLLGRVMPAQALAMIDEILASLQPYRASLFSFGIVVTLWLASVGGKGIIASLDLVYDVHTPRSPWINRALAFFLTLAVGALLLAAVALTLVGPFVERALAVLVPVQSWWLTVWPYLQWLVAAAFTFTAISLLLTLAPNAPAGERLTLPGALLAAVAWMALSSGLGLYLQYFGELKLDRFYGVFATPVAVMIWLYWGAAAILLGAQINASLTARRRSHRPPDSV